MQKSCVFNRQRRSNRCHYRDFDHLVFFHRPVDLSGYRFRTNYVDNVLESSLYDNIKKKNHYKSLFFCFDVFDAIFQFKLPGKLVFFSISNRANHEKNVSNTRPVGYDLTYGNVTRMTRLRPSRKLVRGREKKR